MSTYQAQLGNSHSSSPADAELLLRIGIALATRQRNLWRAVRVAAHHGVVRLEGIVPTFYDRQLILAVAQHVAGVLRVEDEIAVDESAVRETAATRYSEPETIPLAHGGAETQPAGPQNNFQHLPVLDESLEEILAKWPATSAAAV
jgi:hypothetical protein